MKNTILALIVIAICYTAINGWNSPSEDISYNFTTKYEDNSSTSITKYEDNSSTSTTNIYNTTYRDQGYMYNSDDLIKLVTSYYYRDHSPNIQLYYSADYNGDNTYIINLTENRGDHYYIWASYQIDCYGYGYDLTNNPEHTQLIDFVTNTTSFTPSQNTAASYETNTYEDTPDENYVYDYDTQTAPMPDHEIQISEILGRWSPDINAAEPEIIDFYMDNGVLKYDYYTILLGNGNGFNLANETTKFEYNNGRVQFQGNQGRCSCLGSDGMTGYVGFYLDGIADGYIMDEEDGTIFYRV